MMCSIQKMLN